MATEATDFTEKDPKSPPAAGDELRVELERGRAQARQRLETGADGYAVAKELAAHIDGLVVALYQRAFAAALANPKLSPERFAVVATGGYGRGELAPFSDVDLLFLRSGKPNGLAAQVTETMLYGLWDLGLKVGHAARDIDQCLRLAREDHTIRTAMLEARFIAGDQALAAELFRRFRGEIVERDHTGFITAKLEERDRRHARIGASRYMVEPNIKEGKGGLRDLHTLFWLARDRYGQDARQMVEAGVFTEEERLRLRRALKFLWTVRCHLHFVTGRAEERLTFDLQPELARRMGYVARGNRTDVERFMTRYFRAAKEVGALTRILCAKLETDNAKAAPRGLSRLLPKRRPTVAVLEGGFAIDNGRLNVTSPDVIDTALGLMKLFALADERDLDLHPDALTQAARRARRMPASWRDDAAACATFLSVATSPRRPGAALRLMNETGLLGRFVPEFGRIVSQMQFNMYHHYTVDEHTLKAIEAISEIERGKHKNQHPLATDIFPKIVNRRAIYLAMLLHDTGKGEGDQQIEGERSARAACERLGLPAGEVDLVGWLVRHHLVMSDIAQKRDISDPRTVAQFAEVVGDVERLRLLLVLTVADIRAVGPGVWNDWKGQLLRDLYRLTEAALHGGRSDEESVRAQLHELAAQAKLRAQEALGAAPTRWLEGLEDGYWLSHDDDALAWHGRQAAADAGGLPRVATRVREVQAVTEVLVQAADRPGLFASLAAAFSASGANIAGARVHTAADGVAFDIFYIQAADHRPFAADHPGALGALRQRLERAAIEDHPPPRSAPVSRRTAAFSVDPWVRVDNDLAAHATVIEASGRDRMGLLADLARVCADAEVSIVSAHIDTHGERASDVFYVQDGGGRVTNPRKLAALAVALDAALREGEPPAPTDPRKTPLAVGRASTAR